MTMPKVDTTKLDLTEEEFDIFEKVVKLNSKLPATAKEIRATKPPEDGKAMYVWRMVVFMVSPKREHQCMPVTAHFSLPAYDDTGKWRSGIAMKMAKELDFLVDKIVEAVPISEWHGIRKWGQALGHFE